MGICRFCGQEIMGAPAPEKECTCDKAKRWRYREEIKETAAEKIDFLFGEMKDGFTGYGDVPVSDNVKAVLNSMIPHMLDGELKSVTVAVPNICTATIKLTGERVKISRRQSKKVEENI